MKGTTLLPRDIFLQARRDFEASNTDRTIMDAFKMVCIIARFCVHLAIE